MYGRINRLQNTGDIILRERMMLANETPDEFIVRLARAIIPHRAAAVKELLRSATMIPSSAVCRYYNAGLGRPSACYLFVFSRDYNADVKLAELWNVTNMAIKGTGVGVGADNLKSHTSTLEGEIQNSFVDICKFISQAINLSVTVRKSRMAVYVSLHNISAYMCLGLRQQNNLITPNVFYGIMIPDVFMKAVERDDAMWYFFDGSAALEGRSLNECYGDEYEQLYRRMVDEGMYVKSMSARALLGEIVSCIAENGFPYIIWRDRVNEYNGQKALGTIQTLNLCAEVCQHSSDSLLERNASFCTLMTLNVAAFCETYTQAWHEMREDFRDAALPFALVESIVEKGDSLLTHCMYAGYMCTLVLNYMLGDSARREIGVSPTGLFDAVCIKYGVETAYDGAMEESVGPIAEHIYLGCVLASVVYNRLYKVECVNFKHSAFARGQFQFDLRQCTPSLRDQWNIVRSYAKEGMANSMLTAQAPAATTSLITNVTESSQFPLPGEITTKNSKTGRFADLPFYAYFTNGGGAVKPHRDVSVRKQVKVYANMAPYIDQTQSVIVNCRPENEEVLKTIYYTYKEKMKTGIYYLSFISSTQYISLGNDKKRALSKFSECSACTL
uniref:Ribonucleotide reductase large subunit n=1 Tax=Malacosoma sp. alphabaculovirus TaxID=1881632 RepID=A0A1B1V5K3_9ABAC|nr:ribonucleotide reductase large subunit [Malacosoma sp. alphabaculovirus]